MAYTSVDDPSKYFTSVLYTGDGASSKSITLSANSGNFKPDWVWIKGRSSNSRNQNMYDSSRGASERIQADFADAEETQTGNHKTFDTNGFTIGSGNIVNASSESFVSWCWSINEAGGSIVSNTNGSINSTTQVNTTAGISIVLWSGDGSSATIGHGLSKAPNYYVVKNRADTSDCRVGQTVASPTMTDGNGRYMEWNDTKGSTNPGSATTWGSTATAPTSTVFTVGSNNAHNGSSDNMFAICFHHVQGYQKTGTYVGNGSDDGPFNYLGFKPAFLVIKRVDSSGNWHMYDNSRSPQNKVEIALQLNTANSEFTTSNKIDFLATGFKVRAASQNTTNGSGARYFYWAIAESPTVSSEGVPTTARA